MIQYENVVGEGAPLRYCENIQQEYFAWSSPEASQGKQSKDVRDLAPRRLFQAAGIART